MDGTLEFRFHCNATEVDAFPAGSVWINENWYVPSTDLLLTMLNEPDEQLVVFESSPFREMVLPVSHDPEIFSDESDDV